MRCTSINNCPRGNFQIDQQGTKEECTKSFHKWCVGNDATWAHMFSAHTGIKIASYDKGIGLTLHPYVSTESN
jgi:hypothetical protein